MEIFLDGGRAVVSLVVRGLGNTLAGDFDRRDHPSVTN